MASTSNQPSWFSSAKSEPGTPSVYTSLSRYLPGVDIENFATPQVAAAFALGSLSTAGVIILHTRYFRRIPTSEWVHPSLLARKKWIKGVVTRVGDADNFHLYHTPGPFWRWPIKLRRVPLNAKDLKDETIHIRMAGVDAPEASHFGKPAQLYAPEALAWLKNEVEGKRLWVQMIRRDQYGRVVSIPMHPPRLPFLRPRASRCISVAMLRSGYAITYEQSGAEYGRWGKDEFLRYEEAARSAKRGMWASKNALESPAEYKKRLRPGSESDSTVTNTNGVGREKSGKSSWLGSFAFWR